MQTQIIIRFQIPGFHYWPEAPKEYNYLKNNHRHVFYFEVTIPVGEPFVETGREIEFIDFKNRLVSKILEHYHFDLNVSPPTTVDFNYRSCEQIAVVIFKIIEKYFKDIPQPTKISVFEDNENGAELIV